MKKVININFQGQVIAIEETAYELLKQYIDSLKKYFSNGYMFTLYPCISVL